MFRLLTSGLQLFGKSCSFFLRGLTGCILLGSYSCCFNLSKFAGRLLLISLPLCLLGLISESFELSKPLLLLSDALGLLLSQSIDFGLQLFALPVKFSLVLVNDVAD